MVEFPLQLEADQVLTSEGPRGIKWWPGSIKPGKPVAASTAALMFRPGMNEVTLSCDEGTALDSEVEVLLYRMWALED